MLGVNVDLEILSMVPIALLGCHLLIVDITYFHKRELEFIHSSLKTIQ